MSQEPSRTHERDDSITRVPAFSFFLVGEAVAFVIYTLVSRPMWFFLDEWDFLAGRTGGNLGDLFRPHNEHWVTLPVLVYRALWWVFGIRSYRPYQVVIVLLHLGAALLVRAVMRRVGVRPWTATLVAFILVFFGSGYQNIVLPFQMTLVGSLVFGLVHLLLADHDGPMDRRDYLGMAAGCAALMCSGVGVAMVVAVGVAVLIARGWRLALLHTGPLAVIYLAWFAAIGHQGYTGYHATVSGVASFVTKIVVETFGAMGDYRGVSIAIAALLVVGLALAFIPAPGVGRRRRLGAPLALLAGAFVLLFITGYGRAGSGPLPENSRYLHLVTAMLLPALAVAAEAVMHRWRSLTLVVVALLVVGIPSNINVIVNYMHTPTVTGQAAYKQMMLALPRSPVATQVPRNVVPEQQLAHFVTVGWLLSGVASGRIPKPAHISSAEAAIDQIRLSFEQVRATQVPAGFRCVPGTTPLVFNLAAGEKIAVSAPSGAVVITPPSTSANHTFPFHVITTNGPILRAVRPVSFHIDSFAPNPGRVCAPPALLAAARAAGQ